MKRINPIHSKVLAGCFILVGLLMAFVFVSTTLAETADKDVVILANGNILTMNPKQPTASAMAVKGGKIIAVGDLAAVKRAAGKSYEYIDLESTTVVPGFIETHDHIVLYGSVL